MGNTTETQKDQNTTGTKTPDYMNIFEAERPKAARLQTKLKRINMGTSIVTAVIMIAALAAVISKINTDADITDDSAITILILMGFTVPLGGRYFVKSPINNFFLYLYGRYCRDWLTSKAFNADEVFEYAGYKTIACVQTGDSGLQDRCENFALGALFYKYESEYRIAKRQQIICFIRYAFASLWIAFATPIILVLQIAAMDTTLQWVLSWALPLVAVIAINIVYNIIENRTNSKRMDSLDDNNKAEESNRSEKSVKPTQTPVTQSAANQICSENNTPSAADIDVNSEYDIDSTKSSDEERNELQNEIQTTGCAYTWYAHNEKADKRNDILYIIQKILIGLFIATTVGFIVAVIMFHIQIDNGYDVYNSGFATTMTLAVLMAISFSSFDYMDAITNCIELKRCTAWLRDNGLDGSKSTVLSEYQNAKHKYTKELSHHLDLAYYTENPDGISTRIAVHIANTIMQILLNTLAAVLIALAVWGIGTIYTIVVAFICIFLPDLLSYLIRKYFSKTPENWFINKNNIQTIN
ncbi:MAG: hypothetical protein NC184_05995 [Roseburia sp.]|nr:hypothetical protein [Roseburia sp.]